MLCVYSADNKLIYVLTYLQHEPTTEVQNLKCIPTIDCNWIEFMDSILFFSNFYCLLTTHEAAWYITSVLSVCLCVCLSDDNFRKP